MFRVTAIFILNFYILTASPIKDSSSECKKVCHPLDDKKINVHLIPHSHDDLGWLRTFDEYYVGTGRFNAVENAGVQYIISSVIPALKANPDRRFIQVEMGFFWKWWQDQTPATKQDVIDLVNSGQLEMTNGGWSMNDEAASHYQSIIDQFTWGFRKIEDTVGKCGRPTVGWQIDPFGHSREHASLVKELGFDGLVIVRIDYRDKERRRAEKGLDFIWNTNPNFNDSQLFTTMFPDFYFEEAGFCFDVMCWDTITDSNVKSKVAAYAKILNGYKEYYKTKNMMLPMGRDFTYQKAERNFASLDKFIDGFKDHETYNVIYSTPSCYIEAVKNEVAKRALTLEEKSDDFFPYASEPHSFWTGYFTSRPTSKRFERLGNNILQSVKQLATFARINNKTYDKNLEDIRGAMGVMQHHDGITGTEKQAVSDDYARMLHQAIEKAEQPVGVIIGDLLKKSADGGVDLKLSTCLLTNVSICETTQKDRFLVVIHNPLSRVVTHYVRLPVEGGGYKITGPDGEEIYDIFDIIHTFDFVKERTKPTTRELVFAARELPALGIKVYYVEKTEDTLGYKPFIELSTEDDGKFGTQTNGFGVDPTTGKLTTVTINGNTQELTQEFLYYPGYTDGTSGEHRSSGAYIFRPAATEALPITTTPFTSVKYARGNLVEQVLQVVNNEISQIIKVYKGSADSYVEFDWLVGNIQMVDNKGKEVITRYTVSNFSNNQVFYTDANGRQQIKRELNKRRDFSYDSSEEPVSSNYYPVTSKIVIKDEKQKLEVAVLNDRAEGGSSLQEGAIELMIHRRLKQDDGYGVGEVLNEVQYGKGLYVRGQHYLTFGSTEFKTENGRSSAAFERVLAHRILLAPRVFLAEESSTLEEVQNLIEFKFEALRKNLPENVHILTLEPWKDSYILRLEHLLEKDEDDVLSTEATVDLQSLFTLFDIVEVFETKLGANQPLNDDATQSVVEDLAVVLKPMEIRTFLVKTDKNNIGDTDNEDDSDDNGKTATPYSDDGDTKGSSQIFPPSHFLLLLITLLSLIISFVYKPSCF